MKGKMKNPEMVRRYFSDLRKWIIAVALLFAVTYLAVLYRQSTWVQYTVVPACFLIIFMLKSRYYLLWMKAKKDIRREEITEENIIVQKIYSDKPFNIYNNGGALAGGVHFILEDANGNRYRLYRKNWLDKPDDVFTGAPVRVRYLNSSRIIAGMTELPIPKKERNAQRAAAEFRREFNDYFEEIHLI